MVLPNQHPDPPGDLNSRILPIEPSDGIAPRLTSLLRIHRSMQSPVFFGKSGSNRWDDPRGSYGVLYSSKDDFGAFIETFGHATGIRLIEEDELDGHSLSEIAIGKSLQLVDLTGGGLAKIGADARIGDCDIDISKKWGSAFFDHPSSPDGILYRARHDPSRLSIAVFDRSSAKLGSSSLIVDSFMNPAHEALLARLLDQYGFGLA